MLLCTDLILPHVKWQQHWDESIITGIQYSLVHIKPLQPSDVIWYHKLWPALVQIMVCCLSGTKPLSEPMLDCCLLDSCKYISMKIYSKYNNCHWIKRMWKCCLRNGAQLSQPQCITSDAGKWWLHKQTCQSCHPIVQYRPRYNHWVTSCYVLLSCDVGQFYPYPSVLFHCHWDNDCPNASEVTLKNLIKITIPITGSWFWKHRKNHDKNTRV